MAKASSFPSTNGEENVISTPFGTMLMKQVTEGSTMSHFGNVKYVSDDKWIERWHERNQKEKQ